MTLRNTFFAIASMGLLATGCLGALEPTDPGGGPVGDDDDDDDQGPITPPSADAGVTPPSSAKPMFDETVAPILQASCSAAACHGGIGNSPLKYLPDNIAEYYTVVTSYDDRVVGYFDKTVAPILTRVQPGPHYNITYTPEQAGAISAWLDAELEARSGTGTPPPPGGGAQTPGQVSKQLMAEWSGCMELAVWNEEQIATRWADKGTSEGSCEKCHINGQASFIATRDSERMFNVLTTNKYMMLGYFTPNVTDLAAAKMEINRSGLERAGNAEYPLIEHPQFNVDGQAYEALVRFYDRTMARKAAGTCDPPRLLTP